MKILKKAGGILLVIIGIFFFVSALKMIFVDNPKTKAALKDAVYVDAADTIDPENDGKTVIVCGTFELTEPALMMSLDWTLTASAFQVQNRQ